MLAESRYLDQRQPAGLVAALGRRGVDVSVTDADEMVHDLRQRPDIAQHRGAVVVARGRSLPLLTALAVAERLGARTLNRSTAVAGVRDKAAMAAALVAGRVPTPDTWVGPPDQLARTIGAGAYPLVLKPVFGDNGQGIRLVVRPGDLLAVPWPEPTALAQTVVPSDGSDVKVYAVADRQWAVRVPSPLSGAVGAPPAPVPITRELGALVDRCRELFGLELFGVDCLLTPEGPIVVEVNDFPNYRGVAEADEALADHVLRAAAEGGP